MKRRKEVTALISAQQKAAEALNGLDAHDDGGGTRGDGQAAKAAKFADGIVKAFEQAAPLVGGPSVQKALVPAAAISAPFLDGDTIIHDPLAANHLLSAVNNGPVGTPSGSYLRQTQRTNNAAPCRAGT